MSPDLSIGIIGCGHVVENVHLPVLLAMGCKVAWLHDKRDERIRHLAKSFGLPTSYVGAPLQELSDSDVCLVACPYGARRDYYEWLRGRSSAIFIEKPVALTVAEHLRINGLRKDYEIAVGLNRRASGLVQLLSQAIGEQYFGWLRTVHFEFGGMIITTGGRYNADIMLAGGGGIFETGVHYIDSINYIVEAVEVGPARSAMLFDGDFETHAEGNYTLATRNQSEIAVSFKFSYLEPTENAIFFRFDAHEIKCSIFSARLPEVRSRKTGAKLKLLGGDELMSPNTAYATNYVMWKTFFEGVQDKRITFASSVDSVLTTKVVELIYSGKRHRL